MNDSLRQILVLIFAIVPVITAFVWSEGADEIADTKGPVNFNPASYTFSIWSILYLGIIAYAIYQIWPGQGDRAIHESIGWYVIGATALTALWVPVAAQAGGEKGNNIFSILTMLVIVGVLVFMTIVYNRIRDMNDSLTDLDHWLVQVPMYALFAWITVANIANLSSLLQGYDILSGDGRVIWAVVMLALATIVTAYVILNSNPTVGIIAYALVLVWAFIGIYVKNQDLSSTVATAAIIATLVVAGVTVYHIADQNGPEPLRSATVNR